MQEKTLEEEYNEMVDRVHKETFGNTLEEEFIEKGAYLEHDRWSKWQSYFFSKCSVKPQSQVNGMDDRYVYLALPKDLYERWVRQMDTSYTDLSEQEKEYDRIEVRKYIPLLTALISSREEKAREEGTKEGFQKGKEWERAMWKNGKVELYENDAITQYKEELLGKLPEEETTTDYEWGSHAEGWNDYREAVIKLL